MGAPASILMGFGEGVGRGLEALEASWAPFWEEVTSLKLPPQKNEVPRGDLEEFWLNFETSGLDFRPIWRDFWGPSGGGVGSS